MSWIMGRNRSDVIPKYFLVLSRFPKCLDKVLLPINVYVYV